MLTLTAEGRREEGRGGEGGLDRPYSSRLNSTALLFNLKNIVTGVYTSAMNPRHVSNIT
jgi:hypothetical protein